MKSFVLLSFAFSGLFFFSAPAFAVQVDDIARNITESAVDLPGILSALAYLLALILGVSGVFKLKEHVENPAQNPLRNALIRFLIGGALVALPIIYESMLHMINPGAPTQFNPFGVNGGGLGGLLGFLYNLPIFGTIFGVVSMDFNAVLKNMVESLEEIPGLIAAVAYLLGLVLGMSGLLKLKEHIENPEQNPLREGVIRLLAGGALFALPTIFQAMQTAIAADYNGAGFWEILRQTLSFSTSGYAGGIQVCNPTGAVLGGPDTSIGDSLCGIIVHAGLFPAFLSAIAYIIGMVFGVWGIFKIKAHVINPSQTSLSEGVMRLLAGGAFFAMPLLIEVMRTAVINPVGGFLQQFLGPVTTYNEPTAAACTGPQSSGGLDCAMIHMMNDLLGPMHMVLNFFAFCAGLIFIMIGISRLIKSSQEGARGPGGFGTMATFLTGGALISYNELMRAASRSFALSDALGQTHTRVNLIAYGTPAELAQAHTVISAILKFMIVVGLISFVRGIFIIRGVAEGNNQSSLMAGATHVVGGALAVNLGPLIMLVQSTLGITSGITFS